MKKFLVSVAFLITLFFTQGSKIQATDLSDNFTAIEVDDGRSNIFSNGDVVHVTASFDDRNEKFTKDSTMLISLPFSKNRVEGQAIIESKRLIIEDNAGKTHEVGEYVIIDDQVQVNFNNEIENFKNVSGKISFYLQLKNNTATNQSMQIKAGRVSERLYISSSPQLSDSILADINGEYVGDKNRIAWEIKIKSDVKQLQIINEITGIDQDSVKVSVNGKGVELNKDNVDFEQGMKLKLDGGQVIIRYTTDANATVNVVKIINNKLASVYAGIVKVTGNVKISGQLIQVSGDKDQSKEKISRFLSDLAKLITSQKDKAKEAGTQKTNETKQRELTPTVSKTKLTGFDTPTKNTSTIKTITHDMMDEEIEETAKEPAEKPVLKDEKERVTDHGEEKNDLPKTGESKGFILSIIGIIFLSISTIIFGKKFGK